VKEGLWTEFIHMEQNKYLKVIMKNPEWQKLLMAMYTVAASYANQKKCSMMDIESRGLIRDLKYMTWDMKHTVKQIGTGLFDENGVEILRDVTPENPIPIDYKGHKTYTIEDLLNTEVRKLTLMCPPITQQWMGLLERVVTIKGLTAAERCKFETPVKEPDERWKVVIKYGK
jgi:hypothetical protein